MKTQLQALTKILIIGFLSLSIPGIYSAAKLPIPENDSTSYIQIQGRIGVKDKAVKGNYKVEVLHHNSIISSFTVKNGRSLSLMLKKNTSYVLRISKKGFVPRLICLNTRMYEPGGAHDYTFNFEADFIGNTEARQLNNEALELPVALISYDRSTGNFQNNKDYSSYINQSIYMGSNEMVYGIQK